MSSPPPSVPYVSFNVSAPGKVILHGEHSVVYGKLAVAASLGLRTRLHFCEIESDHKLMFLEFPALNLYHHYSLEDVKELLDKPIVTSKALSNYNFTHPEHIDHDEVLEAVVTFIKEKSGSYPLDARQIQALTSFFYLFWGFLGTLDFELKPFKVKLDSDLTAGSGTGSSASFGVVIAGFLTHYMKIKKCKFKSMYKSIKLSICDYNGFEKSDLELISRWAFQSERIIHGSPSGVDNTVCTFGGLVEFRKGSTPKLVQVTSKLGLILINTNVSRDTKSLVRKVANLREKYPMIVDGILELIEETTNQALECIKKINCRMGDEFEVLDYYDKLGELVDFNHNLLRCLGTSHPKLDEACEILANSGLHGKLTGAGGGGFAICLVPPSIDQVSVDKVVKELNSKGFCAVFTNLGGFGVSVDS